MFCFPSHHEYMNSKLFVNTYYIFFGKRDKSWLWFQWVLHLNNDIKADWRFEIDIIYERSLKY